MNNSATFSLTDYQRGTLTAMGLTVWRQHQTSDPVTEQSPIIFTEDKGKSEQKIGTQNTEGNVPALVCDSLPEHVLFSKNLATHPLFTDILTAMDLHEKPRLAINDSDVELYSDYLLVWQVADNIALHGTILTTPDLSSLSSVEAKKTLWQALHSYKQANRIA